VFCVGFLTFATIFNKLTVEDRQYFYWKNGPPSLRPFFFDQVVDSGERLCYNKVDSRQPAEALVVGVDDVLFGVG
jgi:hypothetical protein